MRVDVRPGVGLEPRGPQVVVVTGPSSAIVQYLPPAAESVSISKVRLVEVAGGAAGRGAGEGFLSARARLVDGGVGPVRRS